MLFCVLGLLGRTMQRLGRGEGGARCDGFVVLRAFFFQNRLARFRIFAPNKLSKPLKISHGKCPEDDVDHHHYQDDGLIISQPAEAAKLVYTSPRLASLETGGCRLDNFVSRKIVLENDHTAPVLPPLMFGSCATRLPPTHTSRAGVSPHMSSRSCRGSSE